MLKPTVYIVVGPTAVGKTKYAIELAQKLKTEIISADARQCYKELNIGVARPSEAELSTVPHHFIASHSIHETVNAGIFEEYAFNKTEELLAQYGSVVMVGGTGLYIKAFAEGMDAIPAIDPVIRLQIQKEVSNNGLAWLQGQVEALDPRYWSAADLGEKQNAQRLSRALEVVLGTGQSILHFQQQQKKPRPFAIQKIGLEMPRAQLYERINQRVVQMVEMGLEAEVKALLPQFHLNALQTVGYQEWVPYFKGEQPIEKVIEAIQQNTRHYAKRQMTWFKKDASIQWT
ncbi:MAG: tRNA (adenosine(37)-N6)-dimethylallyltransferase MiaA [Sediminibacterium sp.]|nr:tRNA (adenosine(37)-N6)-dimethylallyltransferase MiaA [Sediminibacterium sp.]MBP6144415.1 tRNA (adenosine(37)-N6)-dimethylallyltransferase MiaA [Sediminibacterium sp.]